MDVRLLCLVYVMLAIVILFSVFIFSPPFLYESLARPTSRCILFDVENISFNASLQGVPGGKDNILGGHSIGHSKQKTLYEHVPYSERFPR
jgi:hypothetical protein